MGVWQKSRRTPGTNLLFLQVCRGQLLFLTPVGSTQCEGRCKNPEKSHKSKEFRSTRLLWRNPGP